MQQPPVSFSRARTFEPTAATYPRLALGKTARQVKQGLKASPTKQVSLVDVP